MVKHVEIEINGFLATVSIGRTQAENDVLLRSSSQNDIWFHLENMSSPHMVLTWESSTPPNKRYLNQIAALFKDYKNGLGSRYNVIYTEIKNVKLTTTPGQVIPKNVKKIRV